MQENKIFNDYVEKYKLLPLQEKKKRVNNDIKELLAFVEKAKKDLNINDDLLFNREILDLNTDSVSDDDFVEAMFVYIHMVRESLGKYFNEISKILYK